jgi:hypothetical protein
MAYSFSNCNVLGRSCGCLALPAGMSWGPHRWARVGSMRGNLLSAATFSALSPPWCSDRHTCRSAVRVMGMVVHATGLRLTKRRPVCLCHMASGHGQISVRNLHGRRQEGSGSRIVGEKSPRHSLSRFGSGEREVCSGQLPTDVRENCYVHRSKVVCRLRCSSRRG